MGQSRYIAATQGALVLGALFLTPFVFTPSSYEQFLLPKKTWAALLMAGLCLFAVGRACCGREVRFSLLPVQRWLLLFGAWNLALWPLAESPSLAGDRVGWLGICLVLSWAFQEWAQGRPRRLLLAAWGLAVAAGATAAWTLWQDMVLKWGSALPAWLRPSLAVLNRLAADDWRGFLTAGLGNTDFIAMWLAIAYLPSLLMLVWARGTGRMALLLIFLWLESAALIVCWSVGNNGALILGALIWVLALGRRRRQRIWRRARGRLAVWAAGCLLVIAWLSTDTPLNPHRSPDAALPGIFGEAFASARWQAGGPTRGVIYLTTLQIIRENQLLGVGPGNFVYAYPATLSPFLPEAPAWQAYAGSYTNAAHNTLLQTWAELGPIGALCFLLMLAAAFRSLWKKAHRLETPEDGILEADAAPVCSPMESWIGWGGLGALIVFCGTGLMSFPLELPATTILFFCLLPLGEMLGQAERDVHGFVMPPVIFEENRGRLTLYPRGMQQLVAASVSLHLSLWARRVIIPILIALGLLWAWHLWQPLRSDRIYGAARRELQMLSMLGQHAPPPGEARDRLDALFQKALQAWPEHHDCRSAYSNYLLMTGRPQACLDQIERVWLRLNASELFLRAAEAKKSLGQEAEARAYLQMFRLRRGEAAQ